MWFRRIVCIATMSALALLCGGAGMGAALPRSSSLERQGNSIGDLAPIQITLGWDAFAGGGGQARGGLAVARDTRERPRDPNPGWYEWPICLRGYVGVAPASEAGEAPAQGIYWYEWPYCLRGYASDGADPT